MSRIIQWGLSSGHVYTIYHNDVQANPDQPWINGRNHHATQHDVCQCDTGPIGCARLQRTLDVTPINRNNVPMSATARPLIPSQVHLLTPQPRQTVAH